MSTRPGPTRIESLLSDAHQLPRKQTHAQTVKLTPRHRGRNPSWRDIQTSPVDEDQTARISLQIPVMSKSKRQNQQSAPRTAARPAKPAPFLRPGKQTTLTPQSPRNFPNSTSAPPVKAYLRPLDKTRKCLFALSSFFLHEVGFSRNIKMLGQQ
jgi:hypothetical protein